MPRLLRRPESTTNKPTWQEANFLLLGEKSLAAEFISAAERQRLRDEYGEDLKVLVAANAKLDVWNLCHMASGDFGVVSRPRSPADVHSRSGEANGE